MKINQKNTSLLILKTEIVFTKLTILKINKKLYKSQAIVTSKEPHKHSTCHMPSKDSSMSFHLKEMTQNNS
jgi:hypothetical protein